MKLKNITFKHVLTFKEISDDDRIDFLKGAEKYPSQKPGVYVVKEGKNILYIGSYKRGVIRRWVQTKKRDIYHFKKPEVAKEFERGKIVKVFYQDEDIIKKELGYSNNPWISSHSIEDNLLEQYDTKWNKRGSNKKQIGIGLPIAEEPSLITVRTDRVYGDSAVTDGDLSKTD